MTGNSQDLTLDFDDASDELRLLDGTSELVSVSLVGESVANVTITGSGADDDLSIDFSNLDVLASHTSLAFDELNITFDGGGLSDSLDIGDVDITDSGPGPDVDLSVTVNSTLNLDDVDLVTSLHEFFGNAVTSVSLTEIIEDFFIDDVGAEISLSGANVSAGNIFLSANATITGSVTGILGADVDFDIPGFAAAFSNVSSAARVIIDGGAITATGDLSLSAFPMFRSRPWRKRNQRTRIRLWKQLWPYRSSTATPKPGLPDRHPFRWAATSISRQSTPWT